MPESAIRILIVDDHPMMRKGLASGVASEPDMEIVASVGTGSEAVDQFREKQPDVTLMDLNLTPEMTGLEAIRAIRADFPEARIIVISAYKGDEDIFRAMEAGAVTYLLKETLSDELVPVIREVHAGGGPVPPEIGRKLADRIRQPSLTAREVEVFELVAQGLRNKEVAKKLSISEETVQGHMKSILNKLHAQDRTEAVAIGIRRGILHIS